MNNKHTLVSRFSPSPKLNFVAIILLHYCTLLTLSIVDTGNHFCRNTNAKTQCTHMHRPQ